MGEIDDLADGGQLAVRDAGFVDAGAFDAGTFDAGTVDAGAFDAGAVDAGAFDAGAVDAGVVDAGRSDAGVDAGSLVDAGVSTVLVHVVIAGPGAVTSAALGLRCTGTCDVSVPKASTLSLVAELEPNSTFSGWSGACTGVGACSFMANSASTVSATFMATTPSGTTYYVSTTGSDSAAGTSLAAPFKTVTKAVNVVHPGDVIEVRAGTYSENLMIEAPGTASKWITLKGHAGERPVLRGTGAGPTIYFYNDLCDEAVIGTGTGNTDCLAMYWSLEGLEVRGSAGGGGDGNAIKIDTAKVRLKGNRLCCSVADVVKLVRTANDVEILDNEIWQDSAITAPSTNAQGIDIVGADRTHIAGNFVHDVPDIGMYAKGNARNTLIENNVLVNIGLGTNGHGIMLGQSTDADRLVDGDFESYDGIVRNNVVVHSSWACLATSSSKNVHFVNNSCFDTGTSVHGSIFLSNESEIGTKAVNVEVVNNIIYGSANKPLLKVNADALADPKTLTVDHNVYYSVGGTPTFQPNADEGTVSFAQWLTQYTAMTGKLDSSKVVDPQYATTSGPTPLTLKAASPAIDTGLPTSLVPLDAIGVSRPKGAAVDIGAYEY